MPPAPPPEGQHRRPLDAISNRRWWISTIATDALAATVTAANTANNPAVAQLCWKWVHPSSIRTFHMPDLSPMLDRLCVRRFYVSYVDRLQQHLLLSVDWVVVARPTEDAAGGRRPAVCMLLLVCVLMCAPHQAVTLSFSM